MQKFIARARPAARRASRFIRRYGGRISYYGGVAAALCLLALAAQNIREERLPGATVNVVPAAEMEASVQVQQAQFILPEGFEALRSFSLSPEWNAQLGCWQCHPGVDFRCESGLVTSISDGTVAAMGEDGIHGGWIEVRAGEYLLRYASVAAADGMEPGASIQMGDVIGTADTSMPAEAYMPAHLHLEAMQGTSYVDPLQITEK